MRSKLNATLVLALFGLFCVATACGDDGNGSAGGGDAGESGAGGDGPVSSGGSTTGGKAGSPSGSGGDPSNSGGNPSGSGGDPSGSGGNPVGGGGESAGGGGGGESAGGGEGGGGSVACTEITLGEFGTIVETTYARYFTTITPNIGALGADAFRLSILGPPDRNGGATGTFDLTENGDDNIATCTRCFVVIADPNGDAVTFFQSEGTLVIDPASTQLTGTIDATVTGLKLVEVTIANDSTSTPVPGGACLTVASANIVGEPPPCEGFQCQDGECLPDAGWQCDDLADCDDASDEAPGNPLCVVPVGWTCNEDYVGDGDCDCGCGAKDTDCTSTTNETECEYCIACTGSFSLCPANTVDPQDTTTCL